MGEDTDATPTLNHRGFLPDHNYVTEGKKMTEDAACVYMLQSVCWGVRTCELYLFWTSGESVRVCTRAYACLVGKINLRRLPNLL